MVGAEQLVPGAATRVAMVVSAMVGGFFAMGLAKITHKTALLGVGAVVGGALGAAISAEWLEGAWWASRVDAALQRRASLAADPDTTAYRLIHGENDGLPGLVVDRYDSTLVAKVYTPAR